MDNKDFRLKDYLLCVARIAPLEPVELEAALHACAAGQATARRLLEERHLPHVVAWSLPYRISDAPFLRLIEAGNRALLRTVKRWNDPALDATTFLDVLQAAVEQACEDLLKASPRA
jgi:DNA-directed RNA polymerase sigma subunit (sigma70/sigma32)